jgi:hypothetical protein
MSFYPCIQFTLDLAGTRYIDLHTVLLSIVIFMKIGVVNVAIDARAYIMFYPHFPHSFSQIFIDSRIYCVIVRF